MRSKLRNKHKAYLPCEAVMNGQRWRARQIWRCDARISMSAGPLNPRGDPSDRLLCTCMRASLRSPFLP